MHGWLLWPVYENDEETYTGTELHSVSLRTLVLLELV